VNSLTVLAVCLVLSGALFMTASIIISSKTYRQVPENLLWRWNAMIGLMGFFLLCYLSFAVIEVTGFLYPLKLFVGVIFLAGALFVYLMTALSQSTISLINQQNQALREAHGQLEEKVAERTKELQLATTDLQQEMAERQNAQRELARSNAELDRIINTANDGMRIIDRDCNVIRVNETFQELTGLTTAEMVGHKCYEALPGPGCHTADCAVTRIINGEQLIVNESAKKRADGKDLTCIVRATPFIDPQSGELLGIVESFTDITERKQLEAEREELISQLSRSLEEIKTLKGIVPICSHCKKIRDDKGFWNQLEMYIQDHSDAQLSHGICPGCLREHYPEEFVEEKVEQTEDVPAGSKKEHH